MRRRGRERLTAVLMLSGALAAMPGGVAAQVARLPQGPGTDPLGRQIGAFQVYPSLSVGGVAQSNVYARREDARNGLLVDIGPRLEVLTDNDRFAARLVAAARVPTYLEIEGQGVRSARIDFSAETFLGGHSALGVTSGYERRAAIRGTAENDLSGGDAIVRQSQRHEVRLNSRYSLVQLGASAAFSQERYDDVRLGDDRLLDLSFRNQQAVSGSLRAGISVSDAITLFTQGSVGRADFEEAANSPSRDADRRSVAVGLHYAVTDLIDAELSLGSETVDFAADEFTDFSATYASGQLDWRPLASLTITGRADQDLTTAAFRAAEVVYRRGTGLEARWIANEAIEITTGVSFDQERYEGLDLASRSGSAQFAVQYSLGRSTAVEARLSYREREVDTASDLVVPFEATEIGLRLRYRL